MTNMGAAIHGGGGAAPIQILDATPEHLRKRLLIAPVAQYVEVRNQATDGSTQSFHIPADQIMVVKSKIAASRAWWIYRGAAGAVNVSWYYEYEEEEPEEPTEAPPIEEPGKEEPTKTLWPFKWGPFRW